MIDHKNREINFLILHFYLRRNICSHDHERSRYRDCSCCRPEPEVKAKETRMYRRWESDYRWVIEVHDFLR